MTQCAIADFPGACHTLRNTLVCTLPDADPLPDWVTPDPFTPAELARLARTTHPKAREQFRRGRAVLRSALGLWLGVSPQAVPLALTADGKPVLEGFPGQHFNLSHTDGVAVFAFAHVPVGVDVERHSPTRDLAGLVRRYFTPEEVEQFHALADDAKPAAFLRGWTCKEAILKGVGCGVRELANCAVDLDPTRPPRVLRSPAGAWALTTWEVATGVAVAVAVAVGGASQPDLYSAG
ncbi:MAG: 4'-phosphopantetheinyl transferase superfamily protein [Fimbriiglobus sp.]|nr:4'-phosphopantetheinyl transferase superfamily protein [Fimbriiglobus sp.]